MLGQQNKTNVVVGKDLALLTAAQTREDLVAGKIGVFKNGVNTATVSALSAGDKFKIVFMDVEGKIIESPMYEYSLVTNKSAANYAASSEQKTYIGYNGSTGSIAVNNSDVYHIHVLRKDWSKTWCEHGLFKLAAAYESDATATQTEITDALFTNLVKNFGLEKTKSGVTVTNVGRISAAAVTAANAFDNGATVTNGVAAITVATSLEYNGGGGTAVAGDYVRVGSVAGGTALTSNVYKITEINSLVLTLDAPVIEASGTYAAGTADLEVIPSATALAANWGLMLASAPVKFVPGLFKFQNVTFDVTLSDAFGSTIITNDTNPGKGVGTYKEVAEIEWELRNVQREAYHNASYPVSEPLNAISTKTYDMINISFENKNARTLNGYDYSFHGIVIATEDESASTVHTDLKTVLGI